MRANRFRLISLGLAWALCGAAMVQAQEASPQPPTVIVQRTESGTFYPSFRHPARIEATDTASVRPIVGAQITALHIQPGATVKQGDLLVELDDIDFRIALAEAKAMLTRAKAHEKATLDDYERRQALFEKNTISAAELERVNEQLEIARADVHIHEARLERAEKQLSDTRVLAPFDGRISAAKYAVGDLFRPGDPTQPPNIATIVATDPVYAVGILDQGNYFNFVARKMRLESKGKTIPPIKIKIELPGGVIYSHEGTFENWDNTAVASTGTIAARISFPNPDGVLVPGENVSIIGSVIEPIEAILIPQKAVGFDQQGHYVLVVGADNLVDRRNIEVGIREGADWSVVSGLNPGETIIVEGLQKARKGKPVTPVTADS